MTQHVSAEMAVYELQLRLLQGRVGEPAFELAVWRVIAEAPDEAGSRWLLAEALRQQKLETTIAAWDDSTRDALAQVDVGPTRQAVHWRHPIDHGEMILIPAGRSLLGNPPLPVSVRGCSLARFPVTNEQFRQFVEQTGYRPNDGEFGEFLSHWVEGGQRPHASRTRHPVVWVSQRDAERYCQWAGGCLPTVPMWERAARGVDGRRFPWGNELPWEHSLHYSPKSRLACLAEQTTCAVGSFPETRSPWGCEDLTGNVSQWCAERGADEQAQVRGACFLRRSVESILAAHPRRLDARRRNQWVGFRVCVR